MIKWIKNLLAKKAGREIAKKLNLTEGTPMENGKPWYKSKTVWTAIVTALISAVGPVSKAFGHEIIIPEWVYGVLAGLGLYGLRTSKEEIK